MESKIDYHVLSMDEIVFDNRNKAYGAFAVRRVYNRNLLKAIILSIGLFSISMSSPAILRKLGLLVEEGVRATEEIIVSTGHFPGTILPANPVKVQKPVGPPAKSEYRVPVEKTQVPVEVKPNETNPSNAGSVTGPVITGPSGGTPSDGTENGGGILPVVKAPEIYTVPVEQMPEFLGGKKAFDEFIDENLIYPIPEKEDQVEGLVKIQFVVNEDGSIVQVSVAKSSGHKNFDAAALKLVKSMPNYKPGRQNGHAVRVLCILPIGFELD